MSSYAMWTAGKLNGIVYRGDSVKHELKGFVRTRKLMCLTVFFFVRKNPIHSTAD
jgi:hypothetical protein